MPLPATFQEKWRLALEEIERARPHRIPHRATVADCGYGDAQGFRAQLRAWNEPYVMEVTASEVRVVPASTPIFEAGGGSRGSVGDDRWSAPVCPPRSPPRHRRRWPNRPGTG